MGDGYATTYQLVMVTGSMCLAVVVMLGAAEIPALARRRSSALLLFGLVALAVLLRAAIPPVGLFHDHNHGYQYLEVMLGSGPHEFRPEYGLGGFGVFRFLLFFLPHEPQSIFGLNIALGALTVLPVYAFARLAWDSERAGLFAALAIAVLPAHVRLSATEDLYVVAGLLEATSFAAMIAYARTGAVRHLALTVASVVLVCQVRETMNLVPLMAIAGFFVFGTEIRQRLRRPSLWVAVAAALVLVAPHVYFFATRSLPALGALGPRFDSAWVLHTGVRMFTAENPYLDASVTMPGFMLLAAAGVLLRFRVHARGIAFVVATVLVFSWVAFLKTITETDRIMFHAHYGIFLAVLAGRGASELVARAREPWMRGAIAGCAALVLLSLPLAAKGFLTRESNIQREFACVSEHVPEVPEGCTLVTLTNGEDVGEEPIGVAFGYLSRFGPAKRMSIESFLSLAPKGALESGDSCYVYYEQRICYEPSSEQLLAYCGLERSAFRYPELLDCVRRYRTERTNTYQPLCARMHRDFALREIGVCRFGAAPLDVDPMPPGRKLEIGFYRIIGVREAVPSKPTRPAGDPTP